MKKNPHQLLSSWLSVAALACFVLVPPFALAAANTNSPAQSKVIPGDSVYQVKATMTDQNGRSFKLEEHRGKPVLLSMFYNSCKFVCPMLIDTMALTLNALSAKERLQLELLLITFDPARDDVKALKSIADARELDSAQWTLARTNTTDVRKIAATLGIQYRLLADGEYNHTTVLVLLDSEGRVVGRTKRIGSSDEEFIKLVKKTLQAASHKAS